LFTTDKPDTSKPEPRCTRCVHYYITFDPSFPYGCRILGFKSRSVPEKEVQSASDMPCQSFQPKPTVRR